MYHSPQLCINTQNNSGFMATNLSSNMDMQNKIFEQVFLGLVYIANEWHHIRIS